jgi:plastocyanin
MLQSVIPAAGGSCPHRLPEEPIMRYSLALASLVIASQAMIACTDSSGPAQTVRVSALDQCDSTSFNATLGAGTCKKNGSVTLSQFNAELNATHSVSAWQFSPTALTAQVGQSLVVTNTGGEVHTFTEVENFGGGIIPALNTASGNTTEAPECAQLAAEDFIQAGATVTEEAEDSAGTERYQCCIHPWMRAVVTVASR